MTKKNRNVRDYLKVTELKNSLITRMTLAAVMNPAMTNISNVILK